MDLQNKRMKLSNCPKRSSETGKVLFDFVGDMLPTARKVFVVFKRKFKNKHNLFYNKIAQSGIANMPFNGTFRLFSY